VGDVLAVDHDPQGEVYSLEADLLVYEVSAKNVGAHCCDNARVFYRAAWDISGETLYFPVPVIQKPPPAYPAASAWETTETTGTVLNGNDRG
jgi:hypothetical protein